MAFVSLRDFAEKVSAANTSEEVVDLLFKWQGKRQDAIEVIAKHCRVFDDSLLFLVLDSTTAVSQLLDNPDRPPQTKERIAQHALNRFYREVSSHYIEGAIGMLRLLARRGALPADGPEMREIFEELLVVPKGRQLTIRQRKLLGFLTELKYLPTEAIERVIEVLGDDLRSVDMLCEALAHPHVTPEIKHRVATASANNVAFLNRALKMNQLRRDPVIRPFLLRGLEIDQLRHYRHLFISDANPDDCAKLVREEMAENGLSTAGLALLRAPVEIARCLTKADIEPFLKSEEHQVRVAAITALAHVQDSEDLSIDRPEPGARSSSLSR